jgi:hypothetical protein
MPEGVGYGPQNTASVGKNLNVIGKHSYGYSGIFEFDNSAFVAGLDFTTGSNYQKAIIYWGYPEVSGDNVQSQVYLNSVKVYGQTHNYSHADAGTLAPMSMEILVPPYTRVEIGAINGDGNLRDCLVTWCARIYGKVD